MTRIRETAAAVVAVILVGAVVYGALFLGRLELIPLVCTLTTLAVTSLFHQRTTGSSGHSCRQRRPTQAEGGATDA
jgi:hypothetical protein